MTCIIGYIENGKAFVGGDSAGVAGLGLTIRKDPKVFKVGNRFVIGFTSSFRMGQLLMTNKFCPSEQTSSQSDYQYMITSFVDCVIELFKNNGYLSKDKEVISGGLFIVAYKNKVYYVSADFQVGEPEDNFICIGCGDEIASGAMNILKDINTLSPKEKIIKALESASRFSVGVHAPYNVIELE